MDFSDLKEIAYWAKLENDSISGKITEIHLIDDDKLNIKFNSLGYIVLSAMTISNWDKMDISDRQLSLNLDTLTLRKMSETQSNEVKKRIIDIVDEQHKDNHMHDAIYQQVSDHLKNMGYAIEDKRKPGACVFQAKSSTNPQLAIIIESDDLIIIRTWFQGIGSKLWDDKSFNSMEFQNVINGINNFCYSSKWYVYKVGDVKPTLMIGTWSFGYEKQSFERLIQRFLKDIEKHITNFNRFANPS